MGENFTKKEQIVILLIGLTIILGLGYRVLSKGILSSGPRPIELGQNQVDQPGLDEGEAGSLDEGQEEEKEIENMDIMDI